MADDPGPAAVQAIDKLLADRPRRVGHDFSEATRRLTEWRQLVIARWRHTHADTDRRALERVNAAISVVVGGQFPLGSIPWPHIEQARHDMAALAGVRPADVAPPADAAAPPDAAASDDAAAPDDASSHEDDAAAPENVAATADVAAPPQAAAPADDASPDAAAAPDDVAPPPDVAVRKKARKRSRTR